MGARSHHYILNHLNNLEGSIVEIGCSRGEGSTDFYAGLVVGCKKFIHHAVDFDHEAYGIAKNYADIIENSFAHRMTGEEFLQSIFPNLNEKICYAYLDNFDYNFWSDDNPSQDVLEQISRYRKYGINMTNENSKHAHLIQTQLIVAHAADKCIIHFDDTYELDGYNLLSNAYQRYAGSDWPKFEKYWHDKNNINNNIKQEIETCLEDFINDHDHLKKVIDLQNSHILNNVWMGKGADAVLWLINRNWKIIYNSFGTIALSNFKEDK